MDEIERGEVEMLMQNNTVRTFTVKGKEAVLVNVLFLGSHGQMDEAFQTAGWMNGDRISTRSVLREFRAFLTLSNYPTAPITTQYLQGQRRELTWQQRFKSDSRRDHVRLWEEHGTVLGQDAWLGSYSRETSAALSITQHKFIHHLDRNLDDGVNMLVRDLTLAGCVKSVQLLPRPELPNTFVNATGDEMRTDGMLTVVQLADCANSRTEYTRANPLIPIHPRSRLVRYLRTQVLLYKGDVVRGNLVYSGYYVGRIGRPTLRVRPPHAQEEHADCLPLRPSLPCTPGGGDPAAVPRKHVPGRRAVSVHGVVRPAQLRRPYFYPQTAILDNRPGSTEPLLCIPPAAAATGPLPRCSGIRAAPAHAIRCRGRKTAPPRLFPAATCLLRAGASVP